MIAFPNSPSIGEQYTAAGKTWEWDGVKWVNVTPDNYIHKDGSNSDIDSIQFNTGYAATGSEPVGSTNWNADEDTLETVMSNGVILQHGQEQFYPVTNNTGGTLLNGRVAAYDGTSGNSGKLKIKYGIADYTQYFPHYNLGIITEDISNGDNGKVTYFGKVRGINTTGSLFGETWADEDILYVSPITPGFLTNVMPQAPYPAIPIAVVIHAHNHGTIFVRPTFPSRLRDLGDVDGTPLTTYGQIPVYQGLGDGGDVFDFSHNIEDYVPFESLEVAKALTGFVDNGSITVSYDHANRQITLTGDLRYQWRGHIRELTSPWVSPIHTNTEATHYLYSSDGTNFAWSTTSWDFDMVMIALVRYRTLAVNTFALREVHGLMDKDSHEELHSQVGTYRVSGGLPIAGTYTLNTASDAATTPGFDAAIVKDEDLQTTVSAWTEGSYTQFHVGAGSTSVFTLGAAFPFQSAGSFLLVNDVTTGALSPGINNRYYNVYQLLIPATADANSQAYRTVFIQPQATHTSLAAAQAEDPRGLSLGDLGGTIPEYVVFSRLTYLTANGDANTGKCRLMSITYVLGNRAGQVTVGGFTPSSHAALTDLLWTSSGHTGTANKLAGFGASQEAALYDIPIPFFDATVGTGGDYTDLNTALSDGKYKLLLISDLTLSADTPLINNATIEIHGKSKIYSIITNGYRLKSGTNTIWVFRNLTFTATTTVYPMTSGYKMTFFNCIINDNTTSVVYGFQGCHIYDSVFNPRTTETSYYTDMFCENTSFNLVQGREMYAILGLYTKCSFTGLIAGSFILSGNFIKCTFVNIDYLYQPESIIDCINPTLDIHLAAEDARILNSEFDQLLSSSSVGFCRIMGCEFNGTAVINGNKHHFQDNKFNSTISFSGDYHKFSNNECIGLITLNSGAEYNVIQGNTLTGGLTIASGALSNIITNNKGTITDNDLTESNIIENNIT